MFLPTPLFSAVIIIQLPPLLIVSDILPSLSWMAVTVFPLLVLDSGVATVLLQIVSTPHKSSIVSTLCQFMLIMFFFKFY